MKLDSKSNDGFMHPRARFDALFDTAIGAHDRAPEISETFPAPLHATWDMDVVAAIAENPANGLPPANILPSWVRALSAQEATRLLHACDEASSQRQNVQGNIETILLQTTSLGEKGEQASRIARQMTQSLRTSSTMIRTWLEQHGMEGFVEEEGTYVKRATMLRVEEQRKITKPNLRKLVEHHFSSEYPTPASQRVFMDIGSWNGEMHKTIRPVFSNVIAVEPNVERFDQLLGNAEPNTECVNATLEDLMSDPSLCSQRPDAIYMGHLHYFLQQNETDLTSFDWMVRTMHPKGIGIVTLNDLIDEPWSRAHLRKSFGVREKNPNPEEYRTYLEKKGIAVRVMRPTLSIRAQTDKGMEAMRDVLRFLLPGETRHDRARLDRYLSGIRQHGGEFKHTLYMMAVYGADATVPAQLPFLPNEETRMGREKTVHALGSVAVTQQTNASINIDDIEPIENLTTVTPEKMIETIDMVMSATNNGTDQQILHQLLQKLGIPRAIFFEMITNREKLEAAIGTTATIPSLLAAPKRRRPIMRGSRPRTTPLTTTSRPPDEMEKIRRLFPNGIPIDRALLPTGLQIDRPLKGNERKRFALLAEMAAHQEAVLLEHMLSTKVEPVRRLIKNLLALAELSRTQNNHTA